jgi:hypothetical protein
VKRTRFEGYLIEVTPDPREGYWAVISRGDGKPTRHNGQAKLFFKTTSFSTPEAALAEAHRLIRGGDITKHRACGELRSAIQIKPEIPSRHSLRGSA